MHTVFTRTRAAHGDVQHTHTRALTRPALDAVFIWDGAQRASVATKQSAEK